jgi:acetyl-CoA carboxylase, biotin carboxylase subunit
VKSPSGSSAPAASWASRPSRSTRRPTSSRSTCSSPTRPSASAGPKSADSYLRADRIISAAEIADVDAIHPGYGFLSENAKFAEQCESCNIKFIGPKSKSIKMMGDKAVAKETVRKAACHGPGQRRPVESEAEAVKAARKIGYPVIIKAVAGGGGRGMRIAHNDVSFAKEYHVARNEAEKAFGNGGSTSRSTSSAAPHRVPDPGRQPRQGHPSRRTRLLGAAPPPEADRGVPLPLPDADLRKKMGKAAIRAAEAAEYENAGTIEFLVDAKGNFYFIEMNTRIQVEHPVTEEVTGIDLIKQQIRIANGEKLEFDQGDIKFEKHAIECRINAEDPARNFAPSPGTIGLYYAPGGHGVRVDSHAYSGYTIPPYYDSMIGKLICFGSTRKEALERAYRALSEYLIRGIKTTIPLHKAIMADPVFIEGKATTAYMEELFPDRIHLGGEDPAQAEHPARGHRRPSNSRVAHEDVGLDVRQDNPAASPAEPPGRPPTAKRTRPASPFSRRSRAHADGLRVVVEARDVPEPEEGRRKGEDARAAAGVDHPAGRRSRPRQAASNPTRRSMHSRVVSWLPVPKAIPGSSQSTAWPGRQANVSRSQTGTQCRRPNRQALKCAL